jgi:hypothetical protein
MAKASLPQPGPTPTEHASHIMEVYRRVLPHPRPKIGGVSQATRLALTYLRATNATQCPPHRRGI